MPDLDTNLTLLSFGPRPILIVAIYNDLASNHKLFFALDIALWMTLWSMPAHFLGVNCSWFNASSTFFHLTSCATRFIFLWEESAYLRVAVRLLFIWMKNERKDKKY